MGKWTPFRLNTYGLVVLAVSAAFSGQTSAAAGRVDFATGGATVSRADGQQRPLAKGAELDSGDTIRTDAGGRAQIRFPDGAYVSLQPNTEFSIKEYNFEGKTDGNERGFFALAKGAMRTVTGLIGRVNKNRYQVSTPTATIGIRGTGGLISVLNDGSTLVNGTSGIWTITNPSGTIDVPAGTTGKAPAAPNQPPQQTTEKPSTGPTQPPTTQPPYTQADQRTSDGTSATIATSAPGNPPLVTGANYAVAATVDSCGGDCTFNVVKSSAPVDAVFDSSGRLTSFFDGTRTYTLDPVNGMHGTKPDGTEDFGTRDGVIAWGRWIGQVNASLPRTFTQEQGVHYVVGVPTPVSSLPTNGTLTYNMIGATSPTYLNGGAPAGTVTGASLVVNFLTGAIPQLTVNALDGNGFTYNGLGSGRLDATKPGGIFTTSGSGTGTGCPNTCGFTANGFFAGDAATHAGFAYGFSNTAGNGDLLGAVAVKR